MKEIEKYITQITAFGLNDKVPSVNTALEIQKLLVGLYCEYLNLDVAFDDGGFEELEEEPSFDYDSIKENVEANFPDFGWYHSLYESHLILPDAYLLTGDAIDDLSDIIKDMLEIKWQFENTSEKNATWRFKDIMQNHSEQHLVNFLKYLKDKNG